MRFILISFILLGLTLKAQVHIPAESQRVLDELKKVSEVKWTENMEKKAFSRYPLIKMHGKTYVSMMGLVGHQFDASALPERVHIGSRIKNVITIKIPLNETHKVHQIENLNYIEVSPKIVPHLNQAAQDCRADSVHNGHVGNTSFTGKDVIVGVQDWGFDYTHPMFYDTSLSNTRILASWDQFRAAGTPPNNYNYGSEIIGETDLLAAESDTSNVYYGYGTHGSHVAGIAGGSGAGLEYRGIAFDCDFLFSQFYLDAGSSIDAVDWMSKYADNLKKRLVINMSWGLYHLGPPDGSSLFSQALESFLDEGVVIVTSGGNNGNDNFHIQHDFQNDTIRSQIQFFPYSAHPNMWGQSIGMWGDSNMSFTAGFEVYDNSLLVASSADYHSNDLKNNIDSFLVVNSDTVFYKLSIDSLFPLNQRPHMRMRVQNRKTSLSIVLKSSAASGTVHYWNVTELDNGAGNWGQAFQKFNNQGLEGDNDYAVGLPASTEKIISVGAHLAELKRPNGSVITGSLASFSSRGPTLDNRIKPDITAAGVNVISSISSYTTAGYLAEANVNFKGRRYDFAAFSGTSMSSPVVAGVVALMLEANPNLSAHDVKDILTSTAREDDKTGALPLSGTPEWGHGKTTATRAIEKALTYLSVQENYENESLSIYPNPTNNNLFLHTENLSIQSVEIYNINGALEKTFPIRSSGRVILSLQGLQPGIYLLKAVTPNKVIRSRFIKI